MQPQPQKNNHFGITALLTTFQTEDDCITHLELTIWKDGDHCPYCAHNKIYRFKISRKYKCAACRRVFSIRVGTIFEDSNLKLTVWFMAIYFISISKRGLSSNQLARQLGVTQKTAWFMLQRIRHAMQRNNLRRPILSGTTEADEAEIGGKEGHRVCHIEKILRKKGLKLRVPPGKNQRKLFNNKQVVAGIIEQGGGVVTIVISNKPKNILQTFVYDNVEKGATIYTDSAYGYQNLSQDFNHDTVLHYKKQYVKYGTETTTNHIECYWKNFKQGLVGIYNWVSHEHLQRYCEEFSFRFSNRLMHARNIFEELISGCDAGQLSYKQLKKDAKKNQQAIIQSYVDMSVPI